MKRLLLPILLVAGLLLLLIPGGAWATSCLIDSPANITYTNATAPKFDLRCNGPPTETLNWSWANTTPSGIGNIPQVNVSFSNGSGVNLVLNLTMGTGNYSATNVSGSYTAIPNGSINATFFWYNTTSAVLNNLSIFFTVDPAPPAPVTVVSPFNATYPSGAVNITCNTSNLSTFLYSVDGGANITLNATASNYSSGTTAALADGAHTITCTATKQSNSLSNVSATAYFTVNSTGPTVQWRDTDMLNAASFINENRTINITVTSPWNISQVLIDFPDTYWFGIAVNDSNVMFTPNLTNYNDTVNRTTNVLRLYNNSAAVMIFANNYSAFQFNLFGNSTQTPLNDGDYNITFAWTVNDSKFPTGITVANTTVTVRVRNLSAGPFLLNTTCGTLTDTRTANTSVTVLPNKNACNLTYAAPYLTPGNDTSLTNTTAYGWSCSAPCFLTNLTTNSTATRWLLIVKNAPVNSTSVTLTVSQQTSVAAYLGPIGIAAGAGLAVIYALRRKFRRGDTRTEK